MTYYIEDILHYFVDTINLNDSDKPVLTSISRQCKKGIALTDRQYELVKIKLNANSALLAEHNIQFENNPPRLPLREIDRTKYIKIVDTADVYKNNPYESYKQNYKWIKVRFPFSKKDIVKIESVSGEIVTQRRRRKEYHHTKGSHEHFFVYNPYTAYCLVQAFSNRNFDIEDYILDTAKTVEKILANKKQYLVHVSNDSIVNFSIDAKNFFDIEVGDLSNDAVILKDRALRYGYVYDSYVSDNSLQDIIVTRSSQDVLVDPTKYTTDQLAKALYDLNRFPLVVTLDQDKCCDQLLEIHRAFSYLVENSQQSVLFRVDGDDEQNCYLNQYIKDYNLNNWVDENTKIVYIKKNKLPKALLTSKFKPVAALGKTSMRNNAQVDVYINFNCDLIVYHDNQEQLFGKYAKRYGFL